MATITTPVVTLARLGAAGAVGGTAAEGAVAAANGPAANGPAANGPAAIGPAAMRARVAARAVFGGNPAAQATLAVAMRMRPPRDRPDV